VKFSEIVPGPTAQRTWFCIVVAVVAAAFADPLVEFASNAGVFGTCNCTDHSNLDVIPALSIGLLLGILLLSVRVRNLLGRWAADPATWLKASGDALRPGMFARLVPTVLAIQIAVLYAMETAEQFIVAGHALGGTIWLGAPTPVSLAVHALIGVCATLIIGRTLFACTNKAARIVVFLRRAIAVSAGGPRQMFAHLRYPAKFRRTAPIVCLNGLRAPPLVTG
jgi:hypothetical protein